MKKSLMAVLLLTVILTPAFSQQQDKPVTPETNRWSVKKANDWYAELPWLVGCNFIPSTAINQLEMWQADTFDPETIDRELGYAADLGFNIVRVYLHDLAYKQDPEGFLKRIDQYLGITEKHGIKTMLVIFDDCWLDNAKPGKQPTPLAGVHNSGWLESPGRTALKKYPKDAALRKRLETYVKAVLNRFAKDDRVLIWDLYNEPGNYPHYRQDLHGRAGRAENSNPCQPLLTEVYIWAREVNPSQPVTSCYWGPEVAKQASLNWSDISTYHDYRDAEQFQKGIQPLLAAKRPIIVTEYMARPRSTFKGILPYLEQQKMGAINWGLVAGKSNTIYPWKSWDKAGKTPEPELWFHDIVRKDGTPFDAEEMKFIKKITGKHDRKFCPRPRNGSGIL